MDKLKNNKGFTTVELLIALAIMALVMTAVVLVSFTNQSSLIGSTTNNEAIKIAQKLLEEEQALARKDFHLVNPRSADSENIYTKEVFADLLKDANGNIIDFLTKTVKAKISWKGERGQDQYVELVTLVSNFDAPAGGNTCNSTLTGNWNSPTIENDEQEDQDFADMIGDPDNVYTITDLDAYDNQLYVTVGRATNPPDNDDNTLPTFFVFDINTDASGNVTLDLQDKIDNASSVSYGLNAVRVSEDLASNTNPKKTYAYVASNTGSDYTSCDPILNPSCGQLYIFDVTDSDDIEFGTNLKVLTSPTINGQVRGNSIFYKNNYVFLGLTTNDQEEFHVIDVHNPETLYGGLHLVYPVGSFEIGDDINAIIARGGYAYIASPNTQELKVLNIANPTSPTLVGGFGAGDGNGKSLHLVGDKMYFGKTTGAGSDFFILDNEDPEITLPEINSADISSSVNGVLVRDYLSFILTNGELKIFNNETLTEVISLNLPEDGNSTEPSMDCEGNRIYVSSNNVAGEGFIYIIKPGS